MIKSPWKPFKTAPRTGKPFLAAQDGEIYVAKYSGRTRLCFRTHSLFVGEKHRLVDAIMDGKKVKARVEIDKPWVEEFQHNWTFWTAGFAFRPTLWAPLVLPTSILK